MENYDGKKWQVEGDVGANLMSAGIASGVPFEVACGGNAQCCTCHVHMNDNIMKSQDYTDPEEKEIDAIDFAEESNEYSRLACQMKVT